MAKINFPPASESPWFNPDNGVTYEFVGGAWRTVSTASSLDDIYVKEIGDTMTGELILYGDPVQELGAAPKQYVDTEISDAISTSEGGETGRLDGRYLRKDAGTFNQTVESTGTTTFNGLTTHANGVKLTGGDKNSIDTGFIKTADSGNALDLYVDNTYAASFKNDKAGFGTPAVPNTDISINYDGNSSGGNDFGCTITKFFGDVSAETKTSKFVTFIQPVPDVGALGEIVCVNVQTPASVNGRNVPATIKGFQATQNIGQFKGDGISYGYFSDLNAFEGRTNYNFYADGNSPNFFFGNTYIGGSVSRNTRELWESTLTDEQKEQLAAGTLVVPANVAIPGDGEFARQWWYDQQSAEDQALIDAGELDYPEHFAAATFTDTFALGDNTAINLLSNGRGEFSGGVKVTGGKLSIGPDEADARTHVLISGASSTGGTNISGIRVQEKYNFGDTGGVTGGNSAFLAVPQQTVVNADWNTHFRAEGIAPDGVTVTNVAGFFASSALGGAGTTSYGFYSNLSPDTAGDFNFYASGNAPNAFNGDVLIGGTLPSAPNIKLLSSGDLTVKTNVTIGDTAGAAQRLRITHGTNLLSTDTGGQAVGTINLTNQTGTPAAGALGNGISFTGIGTTRRRALISSYQDGSNSNHTGLAFFTYNGSSTATEQVFKQFSVGADGQINFVTVKTFADNTAAKAGGLVAGDVYRKADGTLMITF